MAEFPLLLLPGGLRQPGMLIGDPAFRERCQEPQRIWEWSRVCRAGTAPALAQLAAHTEEVVSLQNL